MWPILFWEGWRLVHKVGTCGLVLQHEDSGSQALPLAMSWVCTWIYTPLPAGNCRLLRHCQEVCSLLETLLWAPDVLLTASFTLAMLCHGCVHDTVLKSHQAVPSSFAFRNTLQLWLGCSKTGWITERRQWGLSAVTQSLSWGIELLL